MSEVKYLLANYNKTVVEKIYTFKTRIQLINHLITLLQYPPIEGVDKLTLKEIIGHINERWNTIDANEWRLSYMIDNDGIARLIYNDISSDPKN